MAVEFRDHDGAHIGVDRSGRSWRITRTLTGWRLEFRDLGDVHATYAGNHASLAAAKTEADA